MADYAQTVSQLSAGAVVGCGPADLNLYEVVADSFDPSVTGLARALGAVVVRADGTAAFEKVGTGTKDWRVLPFADKKELIADATSTTFSGLVGDADGGYFLDFRLKTAINASVYLRPNGATTNLHAMQSNGVGISDAFIGVQASGANEWLLGSTNWNARSGILRTWQGVFGWGPATAIAETRAVAGLWNETATEITSFDLVSSVASGLKIGSVATLYRRFLPR